MFYILVRGDSWSIEKVEHTGPLSYVELWNLIYVRCASIRKKENRKILPSSIIKYNCMTDVDCACVHACMCLWVCMCMGVYICVCTCMCPCLTKQNPVPVSLLWNVLGVGCWGEPQSARLMFDYSLFGHCSKLLCYWSTQCYSWVELLIQRWPSLLVMLPRYFFFYWRQNCSYQV